MSLIHVTSKKVMTELIGKNRLVFVDFFAKWCGPCQVIMPEIENFSKQFDSIKFAKVDVDEAEELAYTYRIEMMPTFISFVNGVEVDRLSGAQKDAIQRMLNALNERKNEEPAAKEETK